MNTMDITAKITCLWTRTERKYSKTKLDMLG